MAALSLSSRFVSHDAAVRCAAETHMLQTPMSLKLRMGELRGRTHEEHRGIAEGIGWTADSPWGMLGIWFFMRVLSRGDRPEILPGRARPVLKFLAEEAGFESTFPLRGKRS